MGIESISKWVLRPRRRPREQRIEGWGAGGCRGEGGWRLGFDEGGKEKEWGMCAGLLRRRGGWDGGELEEIGRRERRNT